MPGLDHQRALVEAARAGLLLAALLRAAACSSTFTPPLVPSALYEAFPAEEGRRILRRLEFHNVPKHAS